MREGGGLTWNDPYVQVWMGVGAEAHSACKCQWAPSPLSFSTDRGRRLLQPNNKTDDTKLTGGGGVGEDGGWGGVHPITSFPDRIAPTQITLVFKCSFQ